MNDCETCMRIREYFWFQDGLDEHEVILDGRFTLEQLKHIITHMKASKQ
jgi:hypothetical protein